MALSFSLPGELEDTVRGSLEVTNAVCLSDFPQHPCQVIISSHHHQHLSILFHLIYPQELKDHFSQLDKALPAATPDQVETPHHFHASLAAQVCRCAGQVWSSCDLSRPTDAVHHYLVRTCTSTQTFYTRLALNLLITTCPCLLSG